MLEKKGEASVNTAGIVICSGKTEIHGRGGEGGEKHVKESVGPERIGELFRTKRHCRLCQRV